MRWSIAGPGMRQVWGLGIRPREGVLLGGKFGARHCNQWRLNGVRVRQCRDAAVFPNYFRQTCYVLPKFSGITKHRGDGAGRFVVVVVVLLLWLFLLLLAVVFWRQHTCSNRLTRRDRATAVCCAYVRSLCSCAHSISDITSFSCRDQGRDSVRPAL